MTKTQKILAVPAIGTLLLAGAVAGSAGLAFAQSDTTTGSSSVSQGVQSAKQAVDKTLGGHIGKNGAKEELLTGETASKVTAAALAAQPGASIDRVETDADGATYEAHMTKADGTRITVLFDANYSVTDTETGHGGRGPKDR